MNKVEQDGVLPRSMVGRGGEAEYFLRSTVLRAINEVRSYWDEADDVPLDSEVAFRDRAYAQGFRAACDTVRTRFEGGTDGD